MTYTATPWLGEDEIHKVHEFCDDDTGDILVIAEYVDGEFGCYLDKLSDED